MPQYVGNLKQHGEWFNGFIDPKGLEALNQNADSSGFCRIKISKRRTPSAKGFTHVIAIDDYVPENRRNEGHKYPMQDNPRNYNHQNTDLSENYGPVGQDDIPF